MSRHRDIIKRRKPYRDPLLGLNALVARKYKELAKEKPVYDVTAAKVIRDGYKLAAAERKGGQP